MKIVIDISDAIYESFGYEYSEQNKISKEVNEAILDAFCNGAPLPKRKRKIKELPQYTKEYEAYCKGEVDGWNFCLDEILGETDNE